MALPNSADSFKPFDVSQALGNTTPTQPPPPAQSGGCGTFGAILVAVVAAVVTIATHGLTTEWAAEALSELGVSGTTAGSVGAAVASDLGWAASAAIGSVAGQTVGIAIGQQSSYNWREVASAAAAGAVAGSLTGAEGQWATTTPGEVASAAIESAVSQGVDDALGLQKGFNWAAVAAAALAAPLAQAAGSKVSKSLQSSGLSAEEDQIAGSLTRASVDQITYALFTGGKINYAQIVADGFGTPIGDAIVKALTPPSSEPIAASSGNPSTSPAGASMPSGTVATAAGSTPNAAASEQTKNADLQTILPEVTVTAAPIPAGADTALDLFAEVAQPYTPESSAVAQLDTLASEHYDRRHQGYFPSNQLNEEIANEYSIATGNPLNGPTALEALNQETVADAYGPYYEAVSNENWQEFAKNFGPWAVVGGFWNALTDLAGRHSWGVNLSTPFSAAMGQSLNELGQALHLPTLRAAIGNHFGTGAETAFDWTLQKAVDVATLLGPGQEFAPELRDAPATVGGTLRQGLGRVGGVLSGSAANMGTSLRAQLGVLNLSPLAPEGRALQGVLQSPGSAAETTLQLQKKLAQLTATQRDVLLSDPSTLASYLTPNEINAIAAQPWRMQLFFGTALQRRVTQLALQDSELSALTPTTGNAPQDFVGPGNFGYDITGSSQSSILAHANRAGINAVVTYESIPPDFGAKWLNQYLGN